MSLCSVERRRKELDMPRGYSLGLSDQISERFVVSPPLLPHSATREGQGQSGAFSTVSRRGSAETARERCECSPSPPPSSNKPCATHTGVLSVCKWRGKTGLVGRCSVRLRACGGLNRTEPVSTCLTVVRPPWPKARGEEGVTDKSAAHIQSPR